MKQTEVIVTTKQELKQLIQLSIEEIFEKNTALLKGRLLTKKEAAKKLGVCYNTLIKYIAKGWIQTTSHGKIPLKSIQEFMQHRKK